jgi:FtsZ-binding cell division protein ZapB
MLLKAMNREKVAAAEIEKEKDLEIEELRKQLKNAKRGAMAALSGDEATASLMKENDELQEQLRTEQTKSSSILHKKDDTIAFMEMELNRLKNKVVSKDLGDPSRVKRDLDASKAEAQVMKSRYDGAQRRNRILEDDIHHWKSVNIDLEEELADWKSQVTNWKSKYEKVVDVDYSEKSDEHANFDDNVLPFKMTRAPRSAAVISMNSGYNSDEEQEGETGNAISNLWSKLTTPTSRKPLLGDSNQSLKDKMIRSTFH